MRPLDGDLRGPPWPIPYSRATTATLGDDVDGPELVSRLQRPSAAAAPAYFLDAVKPRKPSTPHMQLFVLGYGEAHGKDPDVAPARASALGAEDAVAATLTTMRSEAAVRNRLGGSAFRASRTRHDGDVLDEDDDGGDPSAADAAPADEHPDAFANAIRLPLRIGQVLSVLPVDVTTGSWSRPRAAYSIATNVGLSMLALLSLVMKLSEPNRPSLVDFMVVVFYTMSAITSWLFFWLGRRWWATLLRAFRAQERMHGPCLGLGRKMTTIAAVLLGVSLVEHCLSEMVIVRSLYLAHPNVSTFSECLEIYYNANYEMVVKYVGYWSFTAPFAFLLNFVATFLWNFNDLFVMSMGMALAARFKLLRDSVKQAVGDSVLDEAAGAAPRVLGTAYWRSARRAYNSLTKLARLVDQALNVQLVVSFVNNLYFVCMQLLRGFDDPSIQWWVSVYVLFSFAFLVARTTAVCLLAASVFDNSRSVQEVLFAVCSEDYNEEVHRFLVQVTTEDVALTGLNMFKVTRGLLLTVAGTILTYEVVLVQFN